MCMLKKLYSILFLLLAGTTVVLAQTGEIKVSLIDEKTGETLPFAGVVVMQKKGQVGSGTTDINGDVTIRLLPPGNYDVVANLLGYQKTQISNVLVNEGKTTYLTIKLSSTIVQGKEIVIQDYKVPLIDPGAKVQKTVTREAYQAMAAKNPTNVVAQAAGVFQKDDNGAVSIRGGRSDQDRSGNSTGESSTKVFIDGMRVIGSAGVPQQGVEQVSVITGGVPAEFGDATSGVINITTRGPQSNYFGGVEAISSQPFDKFGYNFFGYSLGGPILTTKGTEDKPKRPILGFIVSGEFSTEKDDNPSAVTNWKVKDDVLRDLEKNPLRPSPLGGVFRNAEFITKEDLEPIPYRQNVRSNIIRFNGKLDFKPTENLLFTVGASIDYNKRHDFVREYALFNPSNNPLRTDNTYRIYGRVTQKFGTQGAAKDEKSSSNIRNAYYTIQGSFTKVNNVLEDDNHRDRFFNYGYLGKFETFRTKSYEFGFDTVAQRNGLLLTSLNVDTLVRFTPDTLLNPYAAAYTSQYFDFFRNQRPDGLYNTLFALQQGGALLNGERPLNVYNLWFNTGRQYNGYQRTEQEQYRVNAQFSADIKKHNIQVGFEWEQRVQSEYFVSPIGLWTLARQSINKHIQQLDKSNPILIRDENGFYTGVIEYDRLSNQELYNGFTKNFREKYGIDEKEWIDIDAIDPSMLSMDLFTADDLLNNANPSYISYYGFDPITGQRNRRRVEFGEFFQGKKENGDYTRNIDAFRPIYTAGYIQDKFDFKDIKFNIGLRLDRFDANQQVLRDPFSFFETNRVGNVSELPGGRTIEHPTNMGSDYVVYVNNIKNPTRVVGYRDPNTNRWYDATGTELANPNKLAEEAGGKIAPYLINPDASITDEAFDPSKSFVDYTPQTRLSPRIAFSFPISDKASFFAHYDVLTQRPSSNLRMQPTRFYFVEADQGAIFNNPNLKPERNVDYEVGYSQILGEVETANSAITMSAFYRELRDNIQLVRNAQAYPVTYTTYGNIDFGTVKGFVASYDLRRTNNIALNVNYTLQFAEGTGNSANEAFGLLQSGQPNLRAVNPLDIDQRHTLVANIDYRFSEGKNYNGPRWNGIEWLANTGANLTVRYGSGIPYTKNRNVLPTAPIGGAFGSGSIEGTLNGSRMPSNYRLDLRVERSTKLKVGRKDSENRKEMTLNIYLQVLNLLNTRNVIEVYKATGSPTDDGYLTNVRAQADIQSQLNQRSFIDLYTVKMNDPRNFSLPRRTRLGITLDF